MIDFEVPYGEKCPNYDYITASRGTCRNCKHVKQVLHTFAFCKQKKEGLECVNALQPTLHGNIDLNFNAKFLNGLSDEEKIEYISKVRERIYQVLEQERTTNPYMDDFSIYLPQY